jgi:Na+-translocating ferredoxin:NAD+ oxidoreductase RnfD subunit
MGFVMAIEPVTTPSSKKAQVIFGAALAVLTSLLGIFAGAIGGEVLLLGLLIMNVLARPIEAWAKKAKAAPSPVPAE